MVGRTTTKRNVDTPFNSGVHDWSRKQTERMITDPDDAVLLSRDLKADFVLEDNAARHLLIGQCKHVGASGSVDESEVNDFFARHEHFSNTDWVRRHGSVSAVSALVDYRHWVDSGWSVSYSFFSTGKASDRITAIARAMTSSYEQRNLNITCHLYDFSGLKEYFVTSQTLEQTIPDVVEIDLPRDRFFEKLDPHPTVVAVVKGNALRNLARQHREALYAWNIRGYLGNRGINKAIANTAEKRPGDFFYFNNGVSAICTSYTLEDNHLTATQFQIINGAQTVSSIRNTKEDGDLEILFRVTKTLDVKTEKGFNQDIIQYNNSQNQIKLSDFRSNDQIQLFLEQALKERKASGPLKKLRYVRKRMVGRRGGGISVRLEVFAKIRYAFLYEPTPVHAVPNSLWSLGASGGVYEKAFGVDGKLEPKWSQETLDEALLAYAFYEHVDGEATKLGKEDPDLKFLKRLRFHGTALAGRFVRKRYEKRRMVALALIRNRREFRKAWTEFWNIAKTILIDVYSTAEEDGSSMFAFVRSEDRWRRMTKRLNRHLAGL